MSTTSASEPADLLEVLPQLRQVDASGQLSPVSLETLYATGLQYLGASEFDKARKIFQLLQSCQPGQPRFHAGLGHSLLGMQLPHEASACFTLACALESDNAGYQLGLGRAYIACGHRQLARLALRCARLNANDEEPGRRIRDKAQALLELIEGHDESSGR